MERGCGGSAASLCPTEQRQGEEERRVYGSTNLLAVIMGEEEGDGEGGEEGGEEVKGILRNTSDPRQSGDISGDNQVHLLLIACTCTSSCF